MPPAKLAIEAADLDLGQFIYKTTDSRIVVHCDRLAIDQHGYIYLLGIIGYSQQIKAIRAALGSKHVQKFRSSGLTATRTGPKGVVETSRWTHDLTRHDGKYTMTTHRLGFGWVHALFTSRDPSFLIDDSENGLWHSLNRPEFTTPILRQWMPYFAKKLTEADRFSPLYGHRCSCATLNTTSDALDEIVKSGCNDGAFSIDFFDVPKTPQATTKRVAERATA